MHIKANLKKYQITHEKIEKLSLYLQNITLAQLLRRSGLFLHQLS